MTADEDVVVDARGHRCPAPTLRLQRALRLAGPGRRVRLLADDPLAKIDVPHFLASKGYRLIESSSEGGAVATEMEMLSRRRRRSRSRSRTARPGTPPPR